MRAAVYKGSQQFAIEEMADPTPGPGQVVVDVAFCAICGTDVHARFCTMLRPRAL